MRDDELAAVMAAARIIAARAYAKRDDVRVGRWSIAGRVGTDDALATRLVACAQSRWAMSGRLRE